MVKAVRNQDGKEGELRYNLNGPAWPKFINKLEDTGNPEAAHLRQIWFDDWEGRVKEIIDRLMRGGD